MYNCEIEIANISFNWKFPFIATQLPAPSTEAFGFMVRNLQPFGITARSINMETPGANMDDVAITITLLNYKFAVRLTYSGIDAEGRNVESDDVIQILQILNIIFDSFEKVNPETKKGTGSTKLNLHLKFTENNVADYFLERVSVKINSLNVEPEAAVFNLNFDEITTRFPTKITIARSLVVENGLFLEINYQSENSEAESELKSPESFIQLISDHYTKLLSFMELNIIREENDNAVNISQ